MLMGGCGNKVNAGICGIIEFVLGYGVVLAAAAGARSGFNRMVGV